MTPISYDKLKLKIAEGKPLLVDFSASWCGPCKVMAPVVEASAVELADKVEIVLVDMDEEIQAAIDYGVRGVPTFVLLRDGRELARRSGAVPAVAFKQWVVAQLS